MAVSDPSSPAPIPRPRHRLVEIALATVLVGLLYLFCQALVTVADPALHPPDAVGATDPATAVAGTETAAAGQQRLQRIRANALPVFILVLTLLALTRRPLLSLWLTVLALSTLYGIDQRKFAVLHAHLLPADLSLLGQIATSPGLYLSYLRGGGLGTIAVHLALTGLVAWLEPAQRWLRPSLCLVLAGIAVALAFAVAIRPAPLADWYDAKTLDFRPWEPDASIQRAGLIASLVVLGDETARRVPDPDPDIVHSVTTQLGEVTPTRPWPATALPDIVLWQSESLFDAGRLSGFESGRWQPGLARARQRSLHGDMTVPAFGGGTVRTEFEALTGLPVRAFPSVSYPYSALAQRPLMALPRALRQLGYHTVAIHPYERGFWSRNTAFTHLGFDRFIDQSHFDHGADRHGIYIGDQALLRQVRATLTQTADDAAPLFVFAISMENHGPWNTPRRLDQDKVTAIPVPDALPTSAQQELRQYLYHLQRADRFLDELIALATERKRHTLVLFYGDHLPGLSDAFATLTFRDGGSAPEQPVPFLLFDNRNPRARDVDASLHSYHLASLLLDAMGLQVNRHFRLLSADRERLAATGLGQASVLTGIDPEQALLHLSWHSYGQDIATPPAAVAPADDRPR